MQTHSWLDTYADTQTAPWLWWALTLLILILLLLAGLKLLRLLPK